LFRFDFSAGGLLFGMPGLKALPNRRSHLASCNWQTANGQPGAFEHFVTSKPQVGSVGSVNFCFNFYGFFKLFSFSQRRGNVYYKSQDVCFLWI